MRIEEASRRTGISRDMIRHYEKLGLVSPARRLNRYRDYDEGDLGTLQMVRTLSTLGISLKEERKALAAGDLDGIATELEAQLKTLAAERSRLAAREAMTQHALACFQQLTAGDAPREATLPARWFLELPEEDSSATLLEALVTAGAVFGYAERRELRSLDGRWQETACSRGLLLYEPRPGATALREQPGIRATLSVNAEEQDNWLAALSPALTLAARRSGATRCVVYSQRLFERREDKVCACLVCEIPLWGTSRRTAQGWSAETD